MKKILMLCCLAGFAVPSFAGEPTPAEPQSVVVSTDGGDVATDTHIRRRGLLRRGYVVVKHTVGATVASTTREVLDGCCKVVRSRTVTKSCAGSCNCAK